MKMVGTEYHDQVALVKLSRDATNALNLQLVKVIIAPRL